MDGTGDHHAKPSIACLFSLIVEPRLKMMMVVVEMMMLIEHE
jgi:hypothetical protein